MEKRRLGRIGHSSSVLIFGGAALGDCTQEVADAAIRQALDAGINHIDTAAAYGGSEDRIGPWMAEIRDRVFLASKVTERSHEAAWASINRSLERLRTDHLDLLQIHAVSDLPTLDAVTAADGALRAAVRARDEGLTTHLGITGHTHAAPSVHLEALRRFDFDSVLTPWSWRLAQDPAYHADFDALVAEMEARDVALMAIKAIARRNWHEGEKSYNTWYRPFDRQEEVTAAVAWVLRHPYVTGIATAGETSLLRLMIEAERQRATMSADRIEEILGNVTDYASPFDESMPDI
jgi:aryl-alcohol dehydrogenase-like predicted oxidoreductase